MVFVTLSLDVGGAERQVALVTGALQRRGWPVTICCFNREGHGADDVRRSGVEVIGPPIDAEGRMTGLARRSLFSGLAALRLYRLLRRRQPAIVHFFLTEPYLMGAPAALAANVPIRIMSRRETSPADGRLSHVRRVEAHLHPRMSAVLGNSRRVMADLAREGCPPDKLGLLYNGVDLAAFKAPRDRAGVRGALGIGADDIATVMVANLIAYKGHADLIDAVARLAPAHRSRLVLLLVGRDDGARAGLEQRAERLGVAGHVRFLGQRGDVADILMACDIGVHASHREGFSNAALESMAAGLPMLVTDVGGNPDAVSDGIEGLVVPAHSPDRLAAGLSRLAADAALRTRLGAAARHRAAQDFTIDASVDRYEALYCGLLAGRTPREIAEVAYSPA